MDDLEAEELQDDDEVEITDLDEPGTHGRPWRFTLPVRKPHLPTRPRRLLILFFNTLILLAVVLVLAAPSTARQLLSSVFVRPTPGPTGVIAPGSDLFYIRISPAWGHISLDGHPVSLPRIGVDPPLRLARGQHVLIWQAEPFLPQRCTVSVPNDLADTCIYRDSTRLNGGLDAWVITFIASLENLAPAPRAALLRTTQNALDARQTTDTVQPGERYALDTSNPACTHIRAGEQCYATASEPLQAALRLQLNTHADAEGECIGPQQPACTLDNQDCRLFCLNPFTRANASGAWEAAVTVRALWTFTTLDGRVLEHDVPDESAWNAGWQTRPDTSLVPLEITWDTRGWHVAVPTENQKYAGGNILGSLNPACASSVVVVESLAPLADAGGTPIYLSWRFFSAVSPATGCLLLGIPTLSPVLAPAPVAPSQVAISCLHRFGVLLQVQSQRPNYHSNWSLPLANAYEQRLARQLSTLVPFPI